MNLFGVEHEYTYYLRSYSTCTTKKFHNLRYINVNNMCFHLPHNKNVHNRLRYINVNNGYSSSTQ